MNSKILLVPCLCAVFFFLSSGAEAQATNDTNSTNSTNVTQTVITPYIPVLFVGGHNIFVDGFVINRTFLPPFQVSVPGILNCSFVPIETPEAEKDRYETSCDYPANYTTKDQVYVPFPLPLLKKFENITQDETDLANLKGENFFLKIAVVALIITAVGAFVMGRLDELKEEAT